MCPQKVYERWPFPCQKCYIKGLGVGPRGRASSYKTLLGTSPRLKPRRKERGCWVRLCKSYIGMCSSKWFLTLFGLKLGMCFPESSFEMAWENSRHFVTQSLTFPRNDVSGKIAEIPYWWRVTTQIWVVFLIRWSKFPSRHDQSEALPRSGLWYSMRFLRSFLTRGETSGWSIANLPSFWALNVFVGKDRFSLVETCLI